MVRDVVPNKDVTSKNTYTVAIWLTLLLLLISGAASAKTQKVLVLHSYHQGLEWTDSISAGIKSVLSARENNVEVYYEYLDTKRNAGHDYSAKLLDLFRAKSNQTPFDLVITSDNNALEFVRKYGSELYSDIPIVFCGVNFFSKELISGMSRVTGVEEKADVKASIELMLDVHPHTQKIMVILDQTTTGIAIRKSVEKVEAYFKEEVALEFYTDFTWDSIGEDISKLGSEYLIYLLTINRDNNNEFISYIDGIDIVNRSAQVPVYGSWDFYLGKGILGGAITSGFNQGKQAATYALRILSGEAVKNLPIIASTPSEVVFDYKVMSKFGISKSVLPPDAVIINEPPSVWAQLRVFPMWFLLLLLTIFILLTSTLILQRVRQNFIVKTNFILDKRVKAKTEELNTSNNRMKQLIQELEGANQKLNLMAIIDSVTNIYNRRYISNRFTEVHQNAKRHEQVFSIAMLDIDYFKVLNDSFGHQFGDSVLHRISQIALGLLREGDILGRYGGEEFLLILPNTPAKEAYILTDKIRTEVEALQWDKGKLKVTISGGIAEYKGQPEAELLRQADVGLYRAKSQGRNNIK